MARPVHCSWDDLSLSSLREKKLAFGIMMIWSAGLYLILSDHSVHYGPSPPVSCPDPELPWCIGLYQQSVERHHIYLQNPHSSGGDPIRDVILRFAENRNLTVVLPWKTPYIFSHTSKEYWHNTDPRAFHADRKNAIICHRGPFNEKFVTTLMPQSVRTLYVGVVHSPKSRFFFTFKYYTVWDPQDYLLNITGPYPIATYLENPKKWEPADPSRSYTNNRMMFDFGLEPEYWSNKRAVFRYLDYLEKRFDLMMVADKLDESLVLLKRLARWPSLRDIIYLHPTQWQVSESYEFNETQRATFHKVQSNDYALYHRFNAILFQKMADESHRGFFEEVTKLKEILDKLKLFCQQNEGRVVDDKIRKKIKSSEWNEEFYFLAKDCPRMTGQAPLVNWTTLELVHPK